MRKYDKISVFDVSDWSARDRPQILFLILSEFKRIK